MRIVLVFLVLLSTAVSGCTATERGAVIGGTAGAVGARILDGNVLASALIGGTAGALLGFASERRRTCRYRYRGRIYVERCPRRYRG